MLDAKLRREEESVVNIKQYYVNCDSPEAKYRSIANIYGVITIGQAIIFCHTRKTASWLVASMTYDLTQVEVILSSAIDAVGANAPTRVFTREQVGHLPTTANIQSG